MPLVGLVIEPTGLTGDKPKGRPLEGAVGLTSGEQVKGMLGS